MRRQDRPRREQKKEKVDHGRATRQLEEPKAREWTNKILADLIPRECKYRKLPNHYLITCPDCLGFPED